MLTGSQPPYVPTEDEIRQACLAIQATWTAEERERRSRYFTGGHDLGIRVCDTAELRRCGVNVGG